MDLTTAYPETAGVKSCIRRVVWNRQTGTLEIRDSWQLTKRSGSIVRIPFYTCSPVYHRGAQWRIAGVPFQLENCTASVKRVPLEDSQLIVQWGESVSRIDVTAQSGASGGCSMIFTFRPTRG